jgi:hypothetical protein
VLALVKQFLKSKEFLGWVEDFRVIKNDGGNMCYGFFLNYDAVKRNACKCELGRMAGRLRRCFAP